MAQTSKKQLRQDINDYERLWLQAEQEKDLLAEQNYELREELQLMKQILKRYENGGSI